jgi:lysine 2,3-aminomutase
MYDFQRGHLNFDLDKLKPKETWDLKLEQIMQYWENDSRLRDILITGGDALMSADASLEKISQCGLRYGASQTIEFNMSRPDGQKYAEIQRVRLGTRLPAYLPQRITPALAKYWPVSGRKLRYRYKAVRYPDTFPIAHGNYP